MKVRIERAPGLAHVRNIGKRIALVSMDAHFHDASIGLYEQMDTDGAPCFLMHTYSQRDGASERIERIAATMKALAGMTVARNGGPALRFPCGAAHRAACRRTFIAACKLDPATPLRPVPMMVYDRKSGADVQAIADDAGRYTVHVPGDGKRPGAIARGLVRLAEMEPQEGRGDCVAFLCGHRHDALVGLLLGSAINMRSAMREAEDAVARGMLAAPGARTT
jgi:hypothetical protein